MYMVAPALLIAAIITLQPAWATDIEHKPSATAEVRMSDAVSQVRAPFLKRASFPADPQKAVAAFRRGAAEHDAVALYNLGVALQQGYGVEADYREANRFLKLSLDQGVVESNLALGIAYREGLGVPAREADALHFFAAAVESGRPEAFMALADVYYKGLGVDRSIPKAVSLYRRAAEKGNIEAQMILGGIYERAETGALEQNLSVKWYKSAAESGRMDAVLNLARLYKEGIGVQRSMPEALRWYRLAADKGNARAQYFVGQAYQDGASVPQNFVESLRWYRSAGVQGDGASFQSIASMYANGQRVQRSRYHAYLFMTLSVSLAQDEIELKDRRRMMNEFGRHLNNEQILRAQSLAMECEASRFKTCPLISEEQRTQSGFSVVRKNQDAE